MPASTSLRGPRCNPRRPHDALSRPLIDLNRDAGVLLATESSRVGGLAGRACSGRTRALTRKDADTSALRRESRRLAVVRRRTPDSSQAGA